MDKPLCVDLCCGLGGWTEAFLEEGYECIGIDTEAHDYGTGRYPGTLIIRDIRSIHGSEFKHATIFVASPPCQGYSYRAMPWSRAKALPPPDNELFNACFRIQREASEAAGHYIPLIVENVRGAQKWVGRARWHYGSFYLWGDVPALMPVASVFKAKSNLPLAKGDFAWNKCEALQDARREGVKTSGHANIRDGHTHTRHLTNQSESDGVKFSQSGDAWFDGKPRDKMLGNQGPAAFGSKSKSRKMASAMIAKIPFPLAQHIARCYRPRMMAVVNG